MGNADTTSRYALRQGHKELTFEQIWLAGRPVKDFLRQTLTTKEKTTQTYYRHNVARLARWAESEQIALNDFSVRHMREYIAVRSEQAQGRGSTSHVTERTLRHDAIYIRVFIRYCASERYIARDPLTDYIIPK